MGTSRFLGGTDQWNKDQKLPFLKLAWEGQKIRMRLRTLYKNKANPSRIETSYSLAAPDCPTDNLARNLALFLYGKLPKSQKK